MNKSLITVISGVVQNATRCMFVIGGLHQNIFQIILLWHCSKLAIVFTSAICMRVKECLHSLYDLDGVNLTLIIRLFNKRKSMNIGYAFILSNKYVSVSYRLITQLLSRDIISHKQTLSLTYCCNNYATFDTKHFKTIQ